MSERNRDEWNRVSYRGGKYHGIHLIYALISGQGLCKYAYAYVHTCV